MLQLLFSITLFLSAALLFIIQPIVAKILLPVYGGTPAVWTLCMLFFQTLLLCSYAYAWLLSRLDKPWFWRCLHLLLIIASLSTYPFNLVPTYVEQHPDLSILVSLIGQLGLPLLVVAASAPLLQFAFSQTRAKQAHDPYFLYAASNVGSLLALLSYPFLIEPYIGLYQQFYFWNLSFLVYLLLLCVVFFSVKYKTLPMKIHLNETLSLRTSLTWTVYSFIPCSLMLGVTFYISTDIAATPLFWVLPLALYLLSYVITFTKKPIVSQNWLRPKVLLFIVLSLISFIWGANILPTWVLIIFHLSAFFVLALFCHGELVASRPVASQLTGFYFYLALGGALAGLFNGLIAPHCFNGAYEYPLVLAMTLLLFRSRSSQLIFSATVLLVLCLASPWFKQAELLDQQRNFYGVKQVLSTYGARVLMSQNTLHGFQLEDAETIGNGAYAYYGAVLPVVRRMQAAQTHLQTTILGLGTGMMACQFRQEDKVLMIDIDQQVIDLASNPRFFSYLRDCPPALSLMTGDGRQLLKEQKNEQTDLLVIDAFSSDAIPTHLLTLEAFSLYRQKLRTEGVILTNISNRHLRLLPVLTAVGRYFDLMVLHKIQERNNQAGLFPAEWVLLTANTHLAMGLLREEGWRFVAESESRLWTDDYSNVLPLLRWG